MVLRLILLFVVFCVLHTPSLAKEANADMSPSSVIPRPQHEGSEQALALGDSLIHKGIELTNQRKLKAALELFNNALEISREYNNPYLEFLALNNIGLCYYYSSEYAKSLDFFLESYEISVNELSLNYEISVLNNIAVVYKADGKFERALEYLNKAYQSALKLGLSNKAVVYGINLGTLYNELADYQRARDILYQAIEVTTPSDENYYFANVSLAESYELEGDLQRALDILTGITSGSARFTDNSAIFIWPRLARVHFEMQNYELALQNARKGIEAARRAGNLHSQYVTYKLMSETYEAQNDPGNAFRYLKQANVINDSLQLLKDQENFAELQARFELTQYENELYAAEIRYQALQRFYTNIIFLALITLALAIYAARIKWANMRQKNHLLQKKEQIAALEMEKIIAQRVALEQEIKYNKERSNLNEKILREELELKNKEVSSKALMNAAQNDIIHQVIQKIDKYNPEESTSFLALKNELKNTIDIDKDWNDFVIHFEQIHSGFFKKLISKHSNLNNNDLRFAAYLRINLGGKEIARLLNITTASYRKRKMRLKEKLGLGHQDNLETYINTF